MNARESLLKTIFHNLKPLNWSQLWFLEKTVNGLLADTKLIEIYSEAQQYTNTYEETDTEIDSQKYETLSLDEILCTLENLSSSELYAVGIVCEQLYADLSPPPGTVKESPGCKSILVPMSDVFPESCPQSEVKTDLSEAMKQIYELHSKSALAEGEEAIQLLSKTIDIAEREEIPTFNLRIEREILSLNMSGVASIHQEALPFYKQQGDIFAYLSSVNQLSDIFSHLGNKQKAMEYLDEAETFLNGLTDDDIKKIPTHWPDRPHGYIKTRLLIQLAHLKHRRRQLTT